MPRNAQRNKGFTLLELLIAIVFITTALFPLLTALTSTITVSTASDSEIMAVNLVQTKIEEIKNTSFNSIVSESLAIVPNYPIFQREVIVASVEANLKDVAVVVYWFPETGVTKYVSLETYVSNF